MNLSTNAHTEPESDAHDRIVAEQRDALIHAQDRVDAAIHDVHRAAGDRTGYRNGNRHATWLLSTREATEQARRVAAGNPPADLPEVVAGRKITATRAGQAIQALAIAEEQRDAEQAKLGELKAARRQNSS